MATVSNVVSDHGQSGADRDDANHRQASARGLGVVEHGSGTVPLVLLHGWPQTSYAWRHVTPLLASDCHTLAYDLPGIGASSRRSTGSKVVDQRGPSCQPGPARRPAPIGRGPWHGGSSRIRLPTPLPHTGTRCDGAGYPDRRNRRLRGPVHIVGVLAHRIPPDHVRRHRPGRTTGRRPGTSLHSQPHRPVRRAPRRDQ